LIGVLVFERNVVFGNFLGGHFALIGILGIFDAADDFGFVGLALFGQFLNTFGIDVFLLGQSLSIARLSAGRGAQAAAIPQSNRIRQFALALASASARVFLRGERLFFRR